MPTLSKADIHIHTTYSHAFMTPEAVIDSVVRQTDLKLIAITDHDTIEGGVRAKAYLEKYYGSTTCLSIVQGSEISSSDGHIIGLFLKDDVRPCLSARETIELIHAQGGLAVAAHPYAHWLNYLGMKGVGNAFRCLPFDAVETRNSSPTELYANYLVEYFNRRSQNLPETGGSDAHYLFMIGSAYTYFEGHTADDFYQALCSKAVNAGGSICNPIALVKAVMQTANLTRY